MKPKTKRVPEKGAAAPQYKLLDSTTETLADLRQVRVICSTDTADRAGDVIVQSGIDLAAYRKNPVVLWGHDPDVPCARAIDISISAGKLVATAQFPAEGEDEDADWVYGKIKAGLVNAVSVGFIPKDYEAINPKSPWGGYKFLKSELLEFSFVSIPANSDCLVIGRDIIRSGGMRPPSKAPTAQPVKRSVKGLYDVSTLANILTQLCWLEDSVEWEAEMEGDGSDIPDRLTAILNELGKILIDMTIEEVGELLQEESDEAVELSAAVASVKTAGQRFVMKLGALASGKSKKTEEKITVTINAEEISEAAVKFVTDAIEKAGRRISAKNKALLQDAMDHHALATKCLKDVMDSNEPDEADTPAQDDPVDAPEVLTPVKTLSPTEERVREARALKESINT